MFIFYFEVINFKNFLNEIVKFVDFSTLIIKFLKVRFYNKNNFALYKLIQKWELLKKATFSTKKQAKFIQHLIVLTFKTPFLQKNYTNFFKL